MRTITQQVQRPTVAVCIHYPRECEKLLSAGQTIAEQMDARLELVHVVDKDTRPSDFCWIAEALYAAAKQYDAELTLLFEGHPVFSAAKYFLFHRPVRIITGLPERDQRFVHGLKEFLPAIPFSMVSDEGIVYNMFPGGFQTTPEPVLVRTHN